VIFWLLVIIFSVCFVGVLLFGAPYVPTLKQQQADALDLLALKPGKKMIELGSGDGRMLRAAAKQGLNVIGYELNPLLVIISYFVTFKYRNQVSVRWGNFWTKDWPLTDAIYVFLLDKFMEKLDKKIIQQYKGKNVKVVSYAFKIPGKKPVKTKGALYLYEY
jgi:hypothetical protein